ncbi:K+-transporting ATPase ATPase C chain [Luteimonas cucumeris]|uniref:Potassium-transporting ATPase KdpC subunit n=1 Tax=Luteimonas cucumeris TaxID=985012 RepID=A0A562L2N6_9GAMM|nr:potassium-transporting ATPase subunit KdpC [Luteimonas cucumeris]TWI01893.1 K+-transporting ATPase ATPase C chain [Luteimonas cucumeris]
MSTRDFVLENGYNLRGSVGLMLVALLLMGLSYSLAAAGLGRVAFPQQATGSIIERDGKAVGSTLIPQPFVADGYFQARPSGPNYDPMAAAGSNLARSNPDLRKRIDTARITVAAREGIAPEAVPIELITQSGSGLDPHITPAGARVQVARVAKARGMGPARLERLIAQHVETRQFGVFGQARVNVLELNLALDAEK